MHSRRTGPDLVRDRQRTTPIVRCYLARDCREKRLCICVPDRKNGDLCKDLHVLEREPLCILGCTHSRCQRITLIQSHLHHAATLNTVWRARRTHRESVVLRVAVVGGIGVDDATDRAMFTRDLRLDTAPRSAVTRDHDRSLHGYAAACEFIIVGRNSVVDIYQRARNVAINRVGIVRRKLLRRLVSCRIARYRWLSKLRDETRRCDHFKLSFLRCREEHIELFYVRIPSSILELCQQPLGVGLVVW